MSPARITASLAGIGISGSYDSSVSSWTTRDKRASHASVTCGVWALYASMASYTTRHETTYVTWALYASRRRA